MLKEHLLRQDPNVGLWNSNMTGVQICRFDLTNPCQELLRSIPVCGAPLQFEVFFCLTGRLAVQLLHGLARNTLDTGIF